MVRKLFYIVGIIVGILVIVLVATLLYAGYQASTPPKLEVKNIVVDDADGYPSLIIDFTTDKYGITFKLFDDKGNLVDMRMPTEGQTRVTLSLVGLKPYTTITSAKTYVLKAFYNDKEIYSKTVDVRGATLEARLVNYTTELSLAGLELKALVVEMRNAGDAPLYVCEVSCSPPLEVYVDGEKATTTVDSPQIPVIRAGESRQIRIELLPIVIKKPKIDVTLSIGDLKTTFTLDFTELFKPAEARVGETIAVDSWRITVTGVVEVQYVTDGEMYFGAKDGMKIVVVHVKAGNAGNETLGLGDLWDFTVVTNAGRSYSMAYQWDLQTIFTPSEDVVLKAVKYKPYSGLEKVAPNTTTEFDVLFQMPLDEKASELRFKVGLPAKEVVVSLTS